MKLYETYNKVIAIIVAIYSTILFATMVAIGPISIFADQYDETGNTVASLGIATFSAVVILLVGGFVVYLTSYIIYFLLSVLAWPFFYLINRFMTALNSQLAAKIK